MKGSVTIRRAQAGDAEVVHALAEAAEASELSGDAGTAGFLIHAQPAAEYAARIAVASHFYLAEADGEVAGFLLAANAASLRVMRRGMAGEDAVVDYVLDCGGEGLVYLDQIAVRPHSQRRGIGRELFRQLVRDSAGGTLMGAILHAPIRNAASIGFFAGEGFRCRAEVREADLLWGIYER
jgi:ribosomal protein S18 acetylase RimI-like enzyme